jgi:hypothetical protein
VTTSSSTPLTCRSAQQRRSMRRVPRFTDRVPIGVGRSITRPLACVSITITFRAVQARARAAAGTRRRILRVATSLAASGWRAHVPLRPTAVRDHSPARVRRRQCRVPLPAQSSRQHRRPEHFVQPATWLFVTRFARRSEYWRSTGIYQKSQTGFRHARPADAIAARRACSFALVPVGMRSVTQISVGVSFETAKYDVFLAGRKSVFSA